MKIYSTLILISLLISNISYADCASAVSSRIKNSANLKESDRARLMDDCEKYQAYRLSVKNDPNTKGAYVVNPGKFSCRDRHDYVDAYNWVLERGGTYNPDVIDNTNKSHSRFKTCEVIKTPTLVAVRKQKDPSSPIVEVLYHSQYSVYSLHEGWIHGAELVPYSDLLEARVK